jgi:hypothetical protein
LKYSVLVLDPGCKGPDGRKLGQECPKLWRTDKSGQRTIGKNGKPAWVGSRHGTAGWAARVPTSAGANPRKRRQARHRSCWRRRTGIEPASDAARRSLVLKTRGTTRNPDASDPDFTDSSP